MMGLQMIELQLLQQEVCECEKCPELVASRTQTVFSDGNPKYLLLLGSIASQALLGKSITTARGCRHEYKGIPTFCTYHPAYVLRNEGVKKDVGKDLRMMLAYAALVATQAEQLKIRT